MNIKLKRRLLFATLAHPTHWSQLKYEVTGGGELDMHLSRYQFREQNVNFLLTPKTSLPLYKLVTELLNQSQIITSAESLGFRGSFTPATLHDRDAAPFMQLYDFVLDSVKLKT